MMEQATDMKQGNSSGGSSTTILDDSKVRRVGVPTLPGAAVGFA
jgi:hypothetical protein